MDDRPLLQRIVPGAVLDHLEALGDWSTARVSAGKIILGELGGIETGDMLSRIDEYYAEVNQRPETVATQLARQLADPHPRDETVTRHLADYKALDTRWHDWASVARQTRAVAVAMLGVEDSQGADDAAVDAPIRNVDFDPSWQAARGGLEVVETVLDRGSLSDWRLLAEEIGTRPWGG